MVTNKMFVISMSLVQNKFNFKFVSVKKCIFMLQKSNLYFIRDKKTVQHVEICKNRKFY